MAHLILSSGGGNFLYIFQAALNTGLCCFTGREENLNCIAKQVWMVFDFYIVTPGETIVVNYMRQSHNIQLIYWSLPNLF